MNGHNRVRRDCPEVNLLSDRLTRIELSSDRSSKVTNPIHTVLRMQEFAAESVQIKPFVRRLPQGAIVEIETVDIDIRA